MVGFGSLIGEAVVGTWFAGFEIVVEGSEDVRGEG